MEAPASQTTTSEQSSPLLRLPAELRNTIYELVADPGGEAIILSEGYEAAANLHVNLAATCRQVKDEYLPIFYQQVGHLDKVQAKVRDFSLDDLSAINRFIDRLPKHCSIGLRFARRALQVTLIFKKWSLGVDPEAIDRWVTAVLRSGRSCAYRVECDWSHFSEHKLWQLNHELTRLYTATEEMRDCDRELDAMSKATGRALRYRDAEGHTN